MQIYINNSFPPLTLFKTFFIKGQIRFHKNWIYAKKYDYFNNFLFVLFYNGQFRMTD